jgi:hypothetical protein
MNKWSAIKAKMSQVRQDTLNEMVQLEVDNIDIHERMRKLSIATRIAFYSFVISTGVAVYFAAQLLALSHRDISIAVIFGVTATVFIGCAMLPFLPTKK